MARDLETLVVSLDADITRLTKQLARAGVNLDDFGKKADKQAGDAAKAINKHLGHGGGSADGLDFQQFQILGHAARASFESIAAGANPLRVLAQEGVKASSAIGKGGLGGLVGDLSSSLGRFLTPARLVGGGIAAIGAAALISATSYEEAQQRIRIGLTGIGAASHATAADIEEIGDRIAATARIGVSAGRDIALAIAQTGRVDKSQIADIGGLARGYGVLTGQSTADAGKDLAKLFADPAKAADTLNERLGVLDGNTLHYIRTLAENGNVQKANQVIINAVGPDLLKAADDVSLLTRAYEALKLAVAPGAIESTIGKTIDRVASGPSIDEQIGILHRALAAARQPAPDTSALDVFGGEASTGGDSDVAAKIEAEIKVLERTKAALERAAQRNADIRRAVGQSNDATPAIEEADPQLKAIEQLEARLATVRTAITNAQNLGVLPTGGYEHAVEAADALDARLKALKADYAQGGTAAANAFRQADFQKQTAGLSSYERGLRQIVHQYDELIRQAKEAGNLRGVPELERAKGEALAAQRTEFLTQPSQYSHSINDVPERYRANVLSAGEKYGVDPNLLASLLHQESRYDQSAISKKGAIGLGQLLPGTAADLGVDPTDASQNIEGSAKYLAQLLARYNQNVALALVGYNAGPGRADRVRAAGGDLTVAPRESQDYVANITTKRPDLKEQADAGREADRALQDQSRTLTDLEKNLGKSNAGLAAAQEAQRQENEAIRSGLPLSDDMKKRIEERATAYADLAQRTAAVRLGADLSFQREELGLSPEQANIAQQLHGAGIDAGSATGQDLTKQMEQLHALQDVKDTGSTFTKGLVSDLIAGTSAGKALENQLQRILGKLADSAVDSLFSSLFSTVLGGGKGGGGGGGLLSGLGGLLTLAGGGRVVGPGSGTSDSVPAMLSHGEFVVNTDSSRKYGGLLSALNSGTVLRLAAGGSVGLPAIPAAALARGSSSPAPVVNYSPTHNITPADGVSPQQLVRVLDQRDRAAARSILSTIETARKRQVGR